jgi:hypothetical protein
MPVSELGPRRTLVTDAAGPTGSTPGSAIVKDGCGDQLDVRFSGREYGPVSWDEAFADQYEEWPADMTADIGFYADLACATDGPLAGLNYPKE